MAKAHIISGGKDDKDEQSREEELELPDASLWKRVIAHIHPYCACVAIHATITVYWTLHICFQAMCDV